MGELIELAESLRWALERIGALEPWAQVSDEEMAAWKRLERVEESIREFDEDEAE